MTPLFTNPLPESAYFRLLEHQKKVKLHSCQPDYPLIFFIFFSRLAAGLSIVSVFFSISIFWTGMAWGCMILATLASITHLGLPLRFLTMLRNNKSSVVWEIRLAGAFMTFLGLQCLSGFGWFQGLRHFFPWINAVLAVLFLISTGWAYCFETHPAWKTAILPMYYIASALMVGLIFRSLESPPSHWLPMLYAILLLTKGFLVELYRSHLKITSPASLKKFVVGREKSVFLVFLWATLVLPGLLTLTFFIAGDVRLLHVAFVTSCLVGIFLERILFFWVESPVFFLSFIENPSVNG